MVPELQCKLLKWLKSHAHIGDLQKTLEMMIRSLLAPKSMVDAVEGVGDVSVEDSSISDTVPVKSVPPRRRTKSSVRTVVDDKLCLSKDKANDGITEGDTDVVGKDPNDPTSESLPDETKKVSSFLFMLLVREVGSCDIYLGHLHILHFLFLASVREESSYSLCFNLWSEL